MALLPGSGNTDVVAGVCVHAEEQVAGSVERLSAPCAVLSGCLVTVRVRSAAKAGCVGSELASGQSCDETCAMCLQCWRATHPLPDAVMSRSAPVMDARRLAACFRLQTAGWWPLSVNPRRHRGRGLMHPP